MKSDDNEDKKLSNQTTAEVSMNIIFDVYDPMTLKKNNFTKIMKPRVVDLKCALFGEVPEKFKREEDQIKGLKSISEFNDSQKEEDDEAFMKIKIDNREVPMENTGDVQMVVVGSQKDEDDKKKQFIIDFTDMGEEEEVVKIHEVEKDEESEKNREKQKEANPFMENGSLLKNMTPPQIHLNYSGNSSGSNNLYEVINMGNRYKMSINSSSSGYSKENMILNLTPDKPRTSSIDMMNSSDKMNHLSDFKNTKFNINNLDYSVNSRPSFLDRNPKPRLSKDYGQNWDCLSINTNDLINSEGVSVLSDNEKQGLLEEIMDMDLEQEKKYLLIELLRGKSKEEANLMVSALRKMPWVFDETLRKRKKELINRKRDRKERRRRSKGKESVWEPATKRGRNCVSLTESVIEVCDSAGESDQQSLESALR